MKEKERKWKENKVNDKDLITETMRKGKEMGVGKGRGRKKKCSKVKEKEK